MTVERLLEQLRELDVRLSLEGERLRCSAPKGRLTPELERDIVARKSEIIRALNGHAEPPPEVLHRTFGQSRVPLSFGQERLWFLQRLQPQNPSHNITAHLRVPYHVEEAPLEATLREIIRRHEVLRTTFPEVDGAPAGEVHEDVALPLHRVDIGNVPDTQQQAAIDSVIREQSKRPFDLALDLPFRFAVVRVSDQDYLFVLTVHHIAADEWSVGVFFQEWRELYDRFASGQPANLDDLPVQYADYARWQRARTDQETVRSQLAYWMKNLEGAPTAIELPFDRSSQVAPSFEGAVLDFEMARGVSEQLKLLARREGVTPFMMLLAVFQVLLSRYTGQTDTLVGTPVSTRDRPELEPLIGFFVNLVALRTKVSPDISTRELMRKVRETVLEAHANMDVPFERLVQQLHPDRNPSHSPVFQVALVYQSVSQSLKASYEMTSAGAMFDMTLYVREVSGRICCTLEYATALFDAATMERFARHFCTLAGEMAAHPDHAISRLPILTAAERKQLIEQWSGSVTHYPRHKCIHELFAEASRLNPDAIALQIFPAGSQKHSESLTYGELDKRSNQLARYLGHLEVGVESRIGVSLERGVDAVVAMLAILKAGGTYVPLDPAYPQQRLDFMLQDAGIEVLITTSAYSTRFGNYSGQMVCLDQCRSAVEGMPSDPVANRTDAENLAYIMYTSGSTGQPKGVAIPHRGVVRLVRDTDYADFSPHEVFLARAPLSFDASTLEIWGSLLNGARLVLFPHSAPTLHDVARAIRECGVTTLWLTSGLFHQMVESEPDALACVRQVLAGGDVLSLSHVDKLVKLLRPGSVLINGYGPTENTTFTCCYRMAAGTPKGNSVPIGRPIANTRVYVLDDNMQPVPVGVKGELFVGGDGLARGYWNRPDLTAEKFVTDPFSDAPGARLYRTGDMVRYLADGNLEFIGRRDNQVKIRGFRVELEEIEGVLSHCAAVREAVVLAQPDASGNKTLICYFTPKEITGGASAAVRSFLTDRLPDHMIPTTFVEVDSLPLTASGKVDRQALPALRRVAHEVVSPRTPLEMQLLTVWEQVLNVRDIGVTDNFFDLGGHSLLAVKLFSQLEKILGMLPISILFQAPTVERMAERLTRDGFAMPWHSLVAIQAGGSKPLLFLVPGIGGNVLGFADLVRHLGPDQPVYGLQSLGFDGKQQPLDCIEDIAAHFVREISSVQAKGPYYLGGACMGGVVAFEMAHQLRVRGEHVALLTLIETWPSTAVSAPPRASGALHAVIFLLQRLALLSRKLAQQTWHERAHYIREKAGLLKAMSRNRQLTPSLRADLLRERVSRANHLAMSRYVPQPYDGRVLMFLAGARELGGGEDPRLVWAKLAGGDCLTYRLEAPDSGWILKEPHVGVLAKKMNQYLEAGFLS